MRAFLLVDGRNMIDYLKIESDGRSVGTGRPPITAVYGTKHATIAVLVCMDIDHRYGLELKERLKQSHARTKVLCIPADMQGHWFSSEQVQGWTGINVVLSNNNVTYPDYRAKSGIAGPNGHWISRQSIYEPICATVA